MSLAQAQKTALVVDDSKSARFALRRSLEAHAYSVETAGSAEEALSYLASHRPDLVFLDHLMPGADGFDALRAIRSDPRLKQIPVVLCSSNDTREFIAQAQAQGASGALQKPPHPEQLRVLLSRLEARSAQLREAQEQAAPAQGQIQHELGRAQVLSAVVGGDFSTGPASSHAPATAPRPPVAPPQQHHADDAVIRSLRSVLPVEGPAANSNGAERAQRDLISLGADLRREIDELRQLLEAAGSRGADTGVATTPAASAPSDALMAFDIRLSRLEQAVEVQLTELRRHVEAHAEQHEILVHAAATQAAEQAVAAAAAKWSQRMAAALTRALTEDLP